MNSRFLFSHKYKLLGWFLFLLGFILGILLSLNDFEFPKWEMSVFPLISEDSIFSGPSSSFEWSKNNIADELASILIIIGGVLVCFSKTKEEDEYISKIRMESLIWATYVNYIVLILTVLFVFDLSFLNVMIYNMFTILLFFIMRFHYVLYKTKKAISYEK